MRCAWVTKDQIYIDYHDNEWGAPVYDDQKLFEFIVLESAQAGLSWLTILKKREEYRAAFSNFDPQIISTYGDEKIDEFMQNPGIVRNRLKIKATITNARAFLSIQNEFGSFSSYLWSFVDGRPIINHWKTVKEVPANTPLSDLIAKELKKRGFKFMGTTICYAHMQAIGMVMDHTCDCFRYLDLASPKRLG